MNLSPRLFLGVLFFTFFFLPVTPTLAQEASQTQAVQLADKDYLLLGELTSVDLKQGALTIKYLINDKENASRAETFQVDKNTKIYRFGELLTLAQLRTGSRIAFLYWENPATGKTLTFAQVKD